VGRDRCFIKEIRPLDTKQMKKIANAARTDEERRSAAMDA
jgi:hypothetical protein